MGMKVDTPHARVKELAPTWSRVRACKVGPRAVKALGQEVLPKLRSHDGQSGAYEAYKARAVFNPVTGRTARAFVGLVFKCMPEVTVPESAKTLLDDVTGTGVPFMQFAAERFGEVIAPGRTGVLVDMPPASESTPGAERPFASDYCADHIVNWRYERTRDFERRTVGSASSEWRKERSIHGAKVLTRVVLREVDEVPDPTDPFATKERTRYRVIELGDVTTAAGVVTIGQAHTLYVEKRDANGGVLKGEWIADGEPIVPTRRGGDPVPFIPFEPCNPESLTMDPDEPPLEGLAELNLSQYRTSADLENGRFKVGHPQFYAFGVTTDDDLFVGDKVWTSNNAQAHAGVVQVQSAFGALENAMAEKDAQMEAEGARLLTKNDGPAETATATKIKKAGERSLLARMADTMGISLTRVLLFMVWWYTPGSSLSELASQVKVTLNTDFDDAFLTGADAEAWLRVQIGGGMSKDSLLRLYARYEAFPEGRSVEDELRLIEQDQAKAAAALGMATDPAAPPADQGNNA